MTTLNDYVQNELYPALFERADRVFPEYDFKHYNGGWASHLKLDLSEPSTPRKEKCVITKKVPQRILEQGGEDMDLISLYQKNNSLSRPIDAIKAISGLLGLQVPEGGNSEMFEAYKKKQDELEKAASRMSKALHSAKGEAVLRYLKDERGYDDDFINSAELGYIDNAGASAIRPLFTYNDEDGHEVCSLPSGTGSSHILTIPYRSGGRMMGFVFRTIGDAYPKYKDAFISATATNKYHLFGLTGLNLKGTDCKSITLVEGELDALRAQYSGLGNVVGVSGSTLSDEALMEAKAKGVQRVCLLFDYDVKEAAMKDIKKRIATSIVSIYKAGLYPLVASFPNDGCKTDTDSYLKNHTGEQLQELIDKSSVPGVISLYRMMRDGIYVEGFKDLNELKSNTIELSGMPYIPPTDRDILFTEFANDTDNQITKESIREEADMQKALEDRGRQKKDTIDTAKEVYSLATSNDPDGVRKAIDLMNSQAAPLAEISKEVELSRLLSLPSRDSIIEGFKVKPVGLMTQFAFGSGAKQQPFVLPTGALTYICSPTSHGKSRMLENLALYQAQNGGDGAVLYFTFEEGAEAVNMQMLDIFTDEDLSANNIRTIGSYYRGDERYFHKGKADVFKKKEPLFMNLLTSGRLRVYSEDYDSNGLIAAIRFISKKIKVKAVFVDYIQLLHTTGSRAFGRKDELADMCRAFMTTAKDTDLPIILAAQLNREAYSPIEMTAQNIAEASEIEHSANTIMLLWNSVNKPLPKSNYYYLSKGEQQLSDGANGLDKMGFKIGTEGKIYAILAKNRGGERNIEAVFDFNGNRGTITQPGYTPVKGEQGEIGFDEPGDGEEQTSYKTF